MNRREMIGKCRCGALGLVAAPLAPTPALADVQTERRYEIEIEIYEAREDTWCHKKGDVFKYPDDMDKICPWLLSSMHDFIILLQRGVTLSWRYEGTPYEKVIDPDGVTTEYIRCPDPTADLVAKVTRTAVT